MTVIDAMKQMVSALQSMVCEPDRTLQQRPERYAKVKEAISAGRQAIEQAEKQEPVAIVAVGGVTNKIDVAWLKMPKHNDKLYTSPQPQKPLTDEQITDIYDKTCKDWTNRYERPVVFARAIEAAHNIKE